MEKMNGHAQQLKELKKNPSKDLYPERVLFHPVANRTGLQRNTLFLFSHF